MKNKFIKKADWKDTALSAAGVITGVVVGSQIKKAITKQDLNGLGLNGEVSNYVVPSVLAGIGILGSSLVREKFSRNVALGLTAVGGAGLLNEATGKQVVSLGTTEVLPGIGYTHPPLLPGIGTTRYIPQPIQPKTPFGAPAVYNQGTELEAEPLAPLKYA